ncbi:RxLR-like protein [Plasmopara halstedii]|uniref:RxLR-like protein n=1 Tax=Plasmopara halstedii TaxID=4781 RepID=A0A0P1AWL4_PLAHL|nr:RxLR-like protein [Plasmopara halstedii]CEG46790.1 RxLR-like protein [Plasmopara halstedii]|eukprot:XP_024583159.1 RxLR-like protein [Plasmopara halstedii]
MRSFSTLVVITATVVMNGGVEFTSAVNDTQGTTYLIRSHTVEDTPQEERMFKFNFNFLKKSPSLKKQVMEDLKTRAETEMNQLVQMTTDDDQLRYNFLHAMMKYGLTWDDDISKHPTLFHSADLKRWLNERSQPGIRLQSSSADSDLAKFIGIIKGKRSALDDLDLLINKRKLA